MPPRSVSSLAQDLQTGEIDFRNATIQECVRTILCDWATTTSGKRTDPSKLHPLAPYLLEGVRRGLGLEMLGAGGSGAGAKKTVKGSGGAAKNTATSATKKRAAPTGGKAGTATAPASRAKKAKVDPATPQPQPQQWVGMGVGMGFFTGMPTPGPSSFAPVSEGFTPLPGWGLAGEGSRRMTSPPMPRPVASTPKPKAKAKRGPKKEEELDEGFDFMGYGSAYRM